MNKTICAAFGSLALLALVLPVRAVNPVRVMILDGESGGPYHDWQHTTPALKKELEDAGLFKVDVVTAPQSGGDFSTFHPDFSRYQAVVLNYDGQDWPAELKASFENYIKDGGGLVIVHAADNAFPDWQGFNKMIGVGGWRRRNENSGPLWYMKDGKLVSDNFSGICRIPRRPIAVSGYSAAAGTSDYERVAENLDPRCR